MWRPYQFLCIFFFFLLHFHPNLSSSSSLTHLCSHHEAVALIQFKNSFSIDKDASYWDCDDADIKSYPKTKSWKEGTDCCSWEGVSCDNQKGQVIGLDLSCSWLHGTIPSNSSLFHLPHLQKLNLAFNNFSSSKMSSEFGEFASLIYLNLSGSYFSGQVPSKLFHLSKLVSLDLSSNYYPSQTLDKHTLKGSIPRSLGNLTQLRYLDLSYNSFNGQLPYSLTNLTQLEELDISYNSIEGSIPDEVTAFPNLIALDLYHNLLNGTLPSWLYVASSLKFIYLSSNQLSGHIKEFRSASVEVISLYDNKLQGPIPSSISQLLNLTGLYLGSNNLSGTFDFGMFSKLQHLQHLAIFQNSPSLTCTGISAAYELPILQSLILSCNINEFPLFLKGSKDLQFLDLSDNRIDGKFPVWMSDVWKNTFFDYLNLSHNLLIDAEQISRMKINLLDLSFNLIQGKLPIPSSITQFFFISNNNLSGEIPSRICNSSLYFLDLSHNNLRGSIPPCFGNLSKSLSMLNLQKNKFYGIIPPTFAKGCQLSYLNLNGNQLEGPLTRSILQCRELEVLDFGNNKINDTFPHWLGSLKQLQVLILCSNRLHGPIYHSRSGPYFAKIKIFDLSRNFFSGPLPVRYIKNFKAMINLTIDKATMSYLGLDVSLPIGTKFFDYSIAIAMKGLEMELAKVFTQLMSIDLSNNKFEGEIPEDIGQLKSLKGLNLSHNNLSGCIPASIGNMSSLEWLDLSSNKLVGMIPERLVDLTFLSFFNVSGNQLHGLIPQGKQFNTFGNDSYEGNNGLCGFPVSKGCSDIEAPPPNLVEEDGSKSNIAFGWKVVLTGYGCGIVFGLAMGYIIFQTGKPKWFVSLVEAQSHRRRKTSKNGHRSGGGRRRI